MADRRVRGRRVEVGGRAAPRPPTSSTRPSPSPRFEVKNFTLGGGAPAPRTAVPPDPTSRRRSLWLAALGSPAAGGAVTTRPVTPGRRDTLQWQGTCKGSLACPRSPLHPTGPFNMIELLPDQALPVPSSNPSPASPHTGLDLRTHCHRAPFRQGHRPPKRLS